MIDSKVGSNFRITGIGEVLWNVFPGGKRFGGMPSNFACQAQALGANAQIVSCVGQNQLIHQTCFSKMVSPPAPQSRTKL